MKEPLALLASGKGPIRSLRPVDALLENGDYALAVEAVYDASLRLIQGEQNLSVPQLVAWIEALPEAWRGDPRVRFIRVWLLSEQRRTTMALLELDELSDFWTGRLDGPEGLQARRWLLSVRVAEGCLHESEGRRDRARAAFAEACRLMPADPAPPDRMTPALDPSEVERLTALDPTGLVVVTVKALAYFRACGDRAGLARAAHNLGHVYLDLGEPAQARYWLEQALDMKRGRPGELSLAYTLDSLGRCYQQLGLLAEAQSVLDEALRIAARLGMVRIQAASLACLGDIYRDRDEFAAALELYHKALALWERLRDPGGIAETQLAVGTLHRRNGHAGLAADCAAEAHTLSCSYCSPAFRTVAGMHEAIAHLLLGDSDAAGQLARCVAALMELNAPGETLLGYWYLAVDAAQKGQTDQSAGHLQRALAMAAHFRHMHLLAMELPVSASVCGAAGPGTSAQPLAGLIQRASARGLLALLQAVPAARPVVAAAGRLPEATALSVQLLGAFRVLRAGVEVDLGAARSQKAVSLFKFLVAQRGRAVAREQILDAIWPESDPESADRSFEVTLSTLRRLLDPPQGVTLIVRRGRGYMLNPEVPLLLDVDRFRSHLERGNWWLHRGQSALAVAEWEQAEAAYGGDFLADDPYEDWAAADRERLREQYLELVLQLGDVALDGGRPSEAVERAQRVLMADPIREAAYRLLMRAHARQGNRAIAFRDLKRCCEVLRRELGEEPMPETRELARRIRSGQV
ncbi:MAG TPA: BTAD domain-containing putative transcriptional regulator [Symbiobacteriaceae bacterium]|nr:BTAD domain-containing putative transcriptional regulator [Symbiobacteriaceae bacterium]